VINIIDDFDFVDAMLKKLVIPDCWDKYRDELISRVARATCQEYKDKLALMYIEELMMLDPDCLLLTNQEEDKQYNKVAPTPLKSKKEGCSRCPKSQKKVEI
jgi:hypothetical protein